MKQGLNPNQERFVQEYLLDLNATQAAIRAGYSPATADVQGSRLLANAKVKAALQAAQLARSKRTQITADMVLMELARVGFSNMGNYARWNESGVELVSSDKLDEDAARCVAEVSQTVTAEGGTVKFKLHDKVSALEKIGKHLGMFTDRTEITGKDGGPVIFQSKEQRDAAVAAALAAHT